MGFLSSNKMKESIAIVQINDWHINEIVGIEGNIHDCAIIRSKARMLSSRIIELLRRQKNRKVIIAITGGIFNNDIKLKKSYSGELNPEKQTLFAIEIIQNFIRSFLSSNFEIEIVNILGKQGTRKNSRYCCRNGKTVIIDDYIFIEIKKAFASHKKVNFIERDFQHSHLLKIFGKNILIANGFQITKKIEKSVDELTEYYRTELNTDIDFVIFGNGDVPLITDRYARAGSFVGANYYTQNILGERCIPSQNLYFINENGSIDTKIINLQLQCLNVNGQPISPIEAKIRHILAA